MPTVRCIAVRAPARMGWVCLLAFLVSAAAGQSPEVEALLEKVVVTAMVRGPDGSIYLAGSTESPNLPGTEGTMSPTPVIVGCGTGPFVLDSGACYDVFVAKLDSDRQDVLFASYLGGTDYDAAFDLFVDAGGNV